MKIVRFLSESGAPAYGSLQPDGSIRVIDGSIYGAIHESNDVVRDVKRLAPVEPTNILGIGMNYQKHAEEGGRKAPERPMWFMKTTNAVQNPGDPIMIPVTQASQQVDFEAELAVVIKKPCRNVKKADAFDYVLGYTCANDVSARDWQFQWGAGQFCQAKSFDTFCPLGPVLVTADEIPRPNDLKIRSILDGEVMQDWTTSDMVFDIPTLIEFLSGSRTLPAGTLILTGTPHGVGFARKPPVWLTPGKTIEIEIEKIGKLSNPVITEQ